jgi:hypothetical protein
MADAYNPPDRSARPYRHQYDTQDAYDGALIDWCKKQAARDIVAQLRADRRAQDEMRAKAIAQSPAHNPPKPIDQMNMEEYSAYRNSRR